MRPWALRRIATRITWKYVRTPFGCVRRPARSTTTPAGPGLLGRTLTTAPLVEVEVRQRGARDLRGEPRDQLGVARARGEVVERDDAGEAVAVDDRQAADAVLHQQLARCRHVHPRRAGDDRLRGVVDRVVLGAAAVGEHPECEVAVGHDPGRPAVAHEHDRADVALAHQRGDLTNRRGRGGRDDRRRHDVPSSIARVYNRRAVAHRTPAQLANRPVALESADLGRGAAARPPALRGRPRLARRRAQRRGPRTAAARPPLGADPAGGPPGVPARRG